MTASIVSVRSRRCLSRASIREQRYARRRGQDRLAADAAHRCCVLPRRRLRRRRRSSTCSRSARERPSETAFLLKLIRVRAAADLRRRRSARSSSASGSWHDLGFAFGTGWIWAALVFWVARERARRQRRPHQEQVARARRARSPPRATRRPTSCARCSATRRRLALSLRAPALATLAILVDHDLEAGLMMSPLQPPVLAALPARARRDDDRSARSSPSSSCRTSPGAAPTPRSSARATFFDAARRRSRSTSLLRVFAEMMYSDEKDGFGGNDPTWVGSATSRATPGLLLLLDHDRRSPSGGSGASKPVAGRIVAVLSSLLLVLLTVAMLAMSGKWGLAPPTVHKSFTAKRYFLVDGE